MDGCNHREIEMTGRSESSIHFYYGQNKWQNSGQYAPDLSPKSLKGAFSREMRAQKLELGVSYKDFHMGISRSQVDGFLSTPETENNSIYHKPINLHIPAESHSWLENCGKEHSQARQLQGIENKIQSLSRKIEDLREQISKISPKCLIFEKKPEPCPHPPIIFLPFSDKATMLPFSFCNSAKKVVQSYRAIQDLSAQQSPRFQATI